MLNFKIISKIFSDFLDNKPDIVGSEDQLSRIIRSSMETNRKLWGLEDSARMSELGLDHVAMVKQEIDKNNQIRNNLIREIDIEIAKELSISSGNKEHFYSETPGMIIDRLSILFIKLSVVSRLLEVIKEKDLHDEYEGKRNIILRQIEDIGSFLDFYFIRLANKEVFFEIQQPVKIYNDKRIREYIKSDSKKQLEI